MENISPRKKLEVEQLKGSLIEHIIILVFGGFALFIIFPFLLYLVFTGATSNVVWLGFIDGVVFFMILFGFLFCGCIN